MISTETYILVIVVVSAAFLFDFLNGFHDAANSIATIVVTRTLTPTQAVILAGFANFIGYFVFGIAIAKTVGKGIIDINHVDLAMILAALLGSVAWNIATWLWGLPTSSSHALIGGLVGAGIAAAGWKVVIVGGLLKIMSFIIIAPVLGMLGSMVFTTLIIWIFRRTTPHRANRIFKNLQLVSATFYSIGHGTNDAQKTMGIIALTLFTAGINTDFHLDNWVVFGCYSAMGVGTMFGGWRIVRTMGTRITKIRAMEGFCAETASALVLLTTAHFGIPVSTTHVIAGSIMGVGTVENVGKVRWAVARKILWAWIITIPITAACSATAYWLISFVV